MLSPSLIRTLLLVPSASPLLLLLSSAAITPPLRNILLRFLASTAACSCAANESSRGLKTLCWVPLLPSEIRDASPSLQETARFVFLSLLLTASSRTLLLLLLFTVTADVCCCCFEGFCFLCWSSLRGRIQHTH